MSRCLLSLTLFCPDEVTGLAIKYIYSVLILVNSVFVLRLVNQKSL